MNNPFGDAAFFLIQTFFNLYIFALLLRVIFYWNIVSFANPIAQFIYRITNPLVLLIKRFIPDLKRIELSTVFVILIIEMLKLLIISWLRFTAVPNPIAILIWSVGDVLQSVLNLYFYAIIITVVLSWFNPMGGQAAVDVLYRVTEPLLARARRFVPTLGGIDISPIIVLIALQLTSILIVTPLIHSGIKLAFIL